MLLRKRPQHLGSLLTYKVATMHSLLQKSPEFRIQGVGKRRPFFFPKRPSNIQILATPHQQDSKLTK